MSFLTPALLGGLVLVAIPVILHLVMRREPQRLLFPALRFVERRRSANQTRLRLRHWILLALRCAAIALLALALARPTLPGSGKRGAADAPVAAAIVVDTSLRMQYVHENQTRLAQAQHLADWLVEQLPAETPTAVLSLATRQKRFAADRSTAQLKLSRLTAAAPMRDLDEAIGDACELLAEQAEYRGEVYVFTDLAAATWTDERAAAIAGHLDSISNASLYLVDVGVERPQNVGIRSLELSGERLASGMPLRLRATLAATGQPSGQAAVELFVEDKTNGQAEKRGQTQVQLEEEPPVATFSLSGLELGTNQGFVRVVGSDPLAVDDIRYFTVDVKPPRRILLVAPTPAQTVFLREALVPLGSSGTVAARFECTTGTYDDLADLPLRDFSAICLLDPGPLAPAVWESLMDFVQAGGGLGFFLGRRASPEQFSHPAAAALVGGKLRWRSRDETYFRPISYDHPSLASLANYSEAIPWTNFPVLKYWELEELTEGASVIASYANGRGAILELAVGQGRTLTMTTPISDPAFGDSWNLLPTGPDPWPFLALATGMVDYLCGARDDRLNYDVGQTVVLHLPEGLDTSGYVLRIPGGEAVRQSRLPGRDEVLITTTGILGNYRLQSGGTRGGLDRGFSTNPLADTSSLARADFSSIATAIGRERVQLARTKDEIDIRVGLGRVGRELFPWMITILALVLGAEHLLANRFYRRE